jgi:hypothetical protein
MLKWTCRLRDLFERKGYQTYRWYEKLCSAIREVEFAGGRFPRKFRWATFRECCNYDEHGAVTPILSHTAVSSVDRLVPAIDLSSEEAQRIRSMSGRTIPSARFLRRKVDVWWLSPTIFISWMEIRLDDACLEDFTVTFLEGGSGWKFRVYSMSAFGNQRQIPSWLVPIDFCRHLITLLPANYFRLISISCSLGPKSVPLEYFLYFLSVIPHDALQPPPRSVDDPWTHFHLSLGRKINQDELRSIFSHRFHPDVMMSFYDGAFNESVSMEVFCNLLREARYLRAVQLPGRLLQKDDSAKLRFEEIRCKSAVLTSYLTRDSCSSLCLLSYSKFHKVTDIHMDCTESTWTWGSDMQQRCLTLHSFLSPFFHAESGLELLSIRYREEYHSYNGKVKTLWIPGIVSACASKDLCFFNVAVEVRGSYRNLARIQSWDQGLFPSLALNYCRKNMMKPMEAFSLAIKAVNHGVIYRKITDHLPSNTKTTNIGVIFYLLKAKTDLLVSWVLAHVILPLRQ